MNYRSVCSGIEAATVAWEPLGWRALSFSEIEPFPCSVLTHRFPSVPNLGDMTRFAEWSNDDPTDVLVGGTPCQSFSVAGLRKGMRDPRGNLALAYCGILDRFKPRWFVWENVPGVLSSWSGDDPPSDLQEGDEWERVEESDFGRLLDAFSELGYGWAWSVRDAQYFGVPQRRRRVFVVGHLGDWRRAAAVLFEPESLCRDSSPRRKAGKAVAALTANGVGTCGADDNQGQAGHLIPALTTSLYADRESCEEKLIVHTLRGTGFDASEDGTGRGTPLVPVAVDITNLRLGQVCGTLEAAQDRGNRGQGVIAFNGKTDGSDYGSTSPTLRAMNGSHANAGGQVAIAFNPQAGGKQTNIGYDETRSTRTAPGTRRSGTAWRCRSWRGSDGGFNSLTKSSPQAAGEGCDGSPAQQ